jgi:hypothetical protein
LKGGAVGILKPDTGKLVYLVIGIALATYTGIAKFLPKR